MKHLLALTTAGLLLVGGWAVHQEEHGPTSAGTASPAGVVADDAVRPVAQDGAPSSPPATRRTAGTPERLVIDALDVDAPVEPVGVAPAGGQEVPHHIDTTGWWRDGSVPGAPGNAVMVGHTASAADGVFDRLGELAPGDEVRVTGPEGTVTFVVDQTRVVSRDAFRDLVADLYRTDGPGGLVLMTCGDWNGSEFESTVVVTATLR